jgi:beta-glucosidase
MRKKMKVKYFLILFLLSIMEIFAQNRDFPFWNPNISFEERVNDLVKRLTLEEKINQMKYDAPAIERLGIPQYNWWNEGLHGVARAGLATVFPQSINLASTWDSEMMFKVATVISDEARAKHHEYIRKGMRGIYQGLTFWSPNINIFRDPRWGRGLETFGEDPYLTGEIGLAFVRGMQGNDPKYFKVIATPKHFAVHSGPEPERHTFDALVSERDLRETYLPAFQTTIVDGKAYSVMCAYNRFRGKPCCGSDELLMKILREEWKFQGYVVSDCWAVEDFYETHKIVKTPEEAVSMSVKSGTDLSCGSCYPKLYNAVRQGLISENDIDVSVKRLFMARFRLGMFDPSDMVPYAKIPYSVNNSKENNLLSLEAARKSIILLKNEKNLLPLSKDIKTIAVIGPNINDVDVLLGNYNGIPEKPITLLSGIKNKVGQNTKILNSQGCNVADSVYQLEPIPAEFLNTPDGHEGLLGEYFNNKNFQGAPIFKRIDKEINFYWYDKTPNDELKEDNYSVRWSGFIVPKVSGKYQIGVKSFNGVKLYIDGTLLFDGENQHDPLFFYKSIQLEKNKKYKVFYEFSQYHNYGLAQLLWSLPNENLLTDAIEKAKKADIVILGLGLSPRLEGEEMKISVPGFDGGDKTNIELPDTQIELLAEIYKIGKPVIMVMFSGSAVAINWANKNIPAIVLAGYPGQQGGNAIADVLFGDYNPAGRLPVTYYKSIDQLPKFSDYNMDGRTYRYFKEEPLYPFGFGLSYTQFEYSNLKIKNEKIKAGENINLSIDIKNSGGKDGDEVVQLYVSDLKSSFPLPVRSLQGFKRLFLKSGEKTTVEFVLTPKQLSLIDDSNRRIVEPGEFEISIGGKQPGFIGSADAKTTGVVTSRIQVIGDIFIVK